MSWIEKGILFSQYPLSIKYVIACIFKFHINNFLNSRLESRDIGDTGTYYEYNYDGRCIKVFVLDSEVTDDTQEQLQKTLTCPYYVMD